MLFELNFIAAVEDVVRTSPALLWFAVFCARSLFFVLPLMGFAMYVTTPKFRHGVIDAGWTLLASSLVTSLIAKIVQRPRPFLTAEQLHVAVTSLIPAPFSSAFPSGHTTVAFALAFGYLFVDRTWGTVAVVIAALVAFGRIAVGVHYPSDILGGIAVAGACVFAVRALHRRMQAEDMRRAAEHHHHT